jgi:hypothetical protein
MKDEGSAGEAKRAGPVGREREECPAPAAQVKERALDNHAPPFQ